MGSGDVSGSVVMTRSRSIGVVFRFGIFYRLLGRYVSVCKGAAVRGTRRLIGGFRPLRRPVDAASSVIFFSRRGVCR